MPAKVFISHTHSDTSRCEPLLACLDAWGIDYWFDIQQLAPGQQFSQRIQEALTERTVFIRICTREALQSFWMSQELAAFRGIAAASKSGDYHTVSFVLDADYPREPLERGEVSIDTTREPQAAWVATLREALGVRAPARRLSRRTVIGASVVTAAAVAAVGATEGVHLIQTARVAPTLPRPKGYLTLPAPQPSQQRLKWIFATELSSSTPSPLGDTNFLYVNANEGLYALSPGDGGQRWFASEATEGTVSGPPALAGGVAFGVYLSHLIATNLVDGSQRWKKSLGQIGINFALAATASAVLLYANAVCYAFTRNGDPLWQTSAGKADPAGIGYFYCVPVGDAVYLSSADGSVWALDFVTGAVRWQRALQTRAAVTVANGTVYASSHDQGMYALDAASGAVLWRVDLGASSSAPITLGNNVAYLGLDGGLCAVDTVTRAVRWKVPQASDGLTPLAGYIRSMIALSGSQLFVAPDNSGYLACLDTATGKVLWDYMTDLGSASAPVVQGNMVFFGTATNMCLVHAFDASAN